MSAPPTTSTGAAGKPKPTVPRWVKWTALGAAVALVLGVGIGLWVHQNSTQNDKLDALMAQQAADRAAAQAKEKKAAADAQAAQQRAKAKAAADAQALKDLAQAQALQKAQQDAAEAKQRAADAQAQANANRAPTVVLPQAPYYPYYPSSSAVWGHFPLIAEVRDYVTVRQSPSTDSTAVGYIYKGDSAAIVCRVVGEYVTTQRTGSSSNWDYVTSPVSGYVADAYVDTRTAADANGAVAPLC